MIRAEPIETGSRDEQDFVTSDETSILSIK